VISSPDPPQNVLGGGQGAAAMGDSKEFSGESLCAKRKGCGFFRSLGFSSDHRCRTYLVESG
tara:strand:+ start:21069 stop:21254 length:186 start_codon:yes stop_codon:yes gene_type:complete